MKQKEQMTSKLNVCNTYVKQESLLAGIKIKATETKDQKLLTMINIDKPHYDALLKL